MKMKLSEGTNALRNVYRVLFPTLKSLPRFTLADALTVARMRIFITFHVATRRDSQIALPGFEPARSSALICTLRRDRETRLPVTGLTVTATDQAAPRPIPHTRIERHARTRHLHDFDTTRKHNFSSPIHKKAQL
jgi:hypothetical protein